MHYTHTSAAKLTHKLLLATLFLWLMVIPATALGGVSGSIRGSVVDSHNAPIAEARLAVRNASGAVLQQTATDASGCFELVALPAGLYALRVEARGFQARTLSLPVANREIAPLTIVLGVEPVVSQVTVTAARAAVEDAGEAARLVAVRGREDLINLLGPEFLGPLGDWRA
jgi:hypothetical protein